MRAMVYRGPYKIRVEEKDVPPIEHPNDAIVRVTLAAICGSDLHLYHGMMPPGVDGRRGRRAAHRVLATGYFGAQLGDIVEGRRSRSSSAPVPWACSQPSRPGSWEPGESS